MQQPALQRDDQSTVELVLVQELVQEPELPAPPSVMELELQLELELLLAIASRVMPLVVPTELVPELVPESVPETMVVQLRAAPPACLGHRPPEAQRPSDDQMPRHHPDQHPRNRT